MNPFRFGCFRSALLSRRPILPVAIIDSYKPFGSKGFGRVETEVHFLPAIPYKEFCDLRPADIAKLVQGRIAAHMEARLGYSVWDPVNHGPLVQDVKGTYQAQGSKASNAV